MTIQSERRGDDAVALDSHVEAVQLAVNLTQWWVDVKGTDADAQRVARDHLITHYAPMVTHVAMRMAARLPDSVELGDLVSYGMFGLIDAVGKFDPSRDIKFETYAGTRVRGAIIDELRATDWVPRSVRSKARSIEHSLRTLEQRLMRPVRDEDIAELLEWDVAEVRTVRAQVSLSHIAALDGMGADEGGHSSIVDIVSSLHVPSAGSAVDDRATRALLADAIQGVRDRERQVLNLYYFENLTLAEIGTILGVTESRVSQIHSGAVKKLRETLVSNGAFEAR